MSQGSQASAVLLLAANGQAEPTRGAMDHLHHESMWNCKVWCDRWLGPRTFKCLTLLVLAGIRPLMAVC